MDAGSCSSQLSAHEQQMPMARIWHKFTAGEEKMWTCGAGTITDHSKSNPCARLFQSPAGNADVLIDFVSVKSPTDIQRSTHVLVVSFNAPKHYLLF